MVDSLGSNSSHAATSDSLDGPPDLITQSLMENEQIEEDTRGFPFSGTCAEKTFDETGRLYESWGRFRVVAELGRGGMGRVYKAYDPKLKRYVALKVMLRRNLTITRRFVNEGLALARVEHDRICKIFEVGEQDGLPFIAMQLIEGEHLHRVAEKLSLEQKLVVMLQVAMGVHEAHNAGLIHRDLKPGNIMVERRPNGGYKPYVLDFGLARPLDEGGMTLEGCILGTPHYMSPEQVRADPEELDARCDVYGLGATLYHILTGGPPFPGSSTSQVLHDIIEKEIPSLGGWKSKVPRGVAAIVSKCLEKDAEKRYPTARALAMDLGRFLDGESVEAQTESRLRLLRRRLSNNLPATLFAVLALILAVFLPDWGSPELRETIVYPSNLVKWGEEIESMARFSHLSGKHDITPDRRKMFEKMENIRREMDAAGPIGIGPGRSALGRGYLAMGDLNAASNHLEAAWNHGYREPENAYALGRVHGALYQEKLWNLLVSGQEVDASAAAFREKARDLIAGDWGLNLEEQAYIWAITVEPDCYFEASRILENDSAWSGWFFERKRLIGDVYRAHALELINSGDAAGSMLAFERAIAAYEATALVAASDSVIYESMAEACLGLLERGLFYNSGARVHALFEDGLDWIDIALEINPNDPGLMMVRGRLFCHQAGYRLAANRDPVDCLLEAVTAANTASDLGGGREAIMELAREIQKIWGQWRRNAAYSHREETDGPVFRDFMKPPLD